MGFYFGFTSASGGTSFNSTNSYSDTHTLIAGETTINTSMTSAPKIIAVTNSSGQFITAGLQVIYELNGSVYDIKITSGVELSNCIVSAFSF